MSIVVYNRGGKTDDAKWLMDTLKAPSKVAWYVEHDSREELLRHENLAMRVVQDDGYDDKV